MKKILSMFLAIAILMSMAVPAMAAEETEETEVVVLETTEPVEEVIEESTEEVSAPAAMQVATSGQCGESMNWSFDAATATLTISGTGDMYAIVAQWEDFAAGNFAFQPEWWNLPVEHIVVAEGVKNISDYAFAQSGAGYENLVTSLQLPTTLEKLPDYGMIFSTGLTELTIPEGIEEVTGWPFGEPNESFLTIKSLYLPASLKNLDILTVYYAGYDFPNRTHTLKNVYFAGTKAQWDQVQHVRSEVMSTLMDASETDYEGFEATFSQMNVVCKDSSSDDFEIPFDELLFVANVNKITAEDVSYYTNETPENLAITVHYKDETTGALPANVRVTYPQWPTEPGTYQLEVVVANKYRATFTATVMATVYDGPEANLSVPVVSATTDYYGAEFLVWEEVAFADYYEVYRATSSTGSYTKIAESEVNVWACENVPTGKAYYYKVVAVYAEDTSLNSAQSNAVSVGGRLARPEIKLSVASTGKTVLTWKKISGAKKYEVYRAVVEDPDITLPITGRSDELSMPVEELQFKKLTTVTSATYTDTSAKTGVTYAYTVRALGSKTSDHSALSTAREQMCFMPTPVLTVKTDAATGKPRLSWKAISGATYYAIGRMRPGGDSDKLDLDNFELWDLEMDNLYYIDMLAEVGQEYTYVIAASNADASKISYASNILTIKCVTAKPVVKGSVNVNGAPVLTWDAVEFAESYKVYRSTSSSKGYKEIATVEELAYTDTTVAAGKTYYYKVAAIAAGTKSADSSYVNLTGKCSTPELSVEAGSTGKPVLTWNKVSGAKKYEIWRSVDGATFKKLTTVTKTTYTDTKATNGAECTYKVKALGSKSTYNGNFSEVGDCKVICAAPSLTAKVDTATGKPSLSWSKVTGATGYAIYRNGELLTTITGVSYLDTTAETNGQYSYYVVSVGKTEDFNSIASATKTVTATVGQPKIKGTVNEDGKPVITWDAVEDAVKYVVYRSTSSSKSYKEIATITDLTYVDTSVAAGKTYYYKVMAVGENSKGAQSAYVKLTGKCAQPVAEATLNAKTGKPVITWEKVSGAKKYDVYRATSVDGKYSKIGTATKTTYTDTKATVGTTYYYKVVAVGSKTAYNSIQSAATEAIPTLIAQPTVTVKNDSKTGAPVVSWGKVSGATEYIVMYADVTEFVDDPDGLTDAYLEENMLYITTTKTSVTLPDTEVDHVYIVTMVAVPKAEEFFSYPTDPKYVEAVCATPKITGFIDEYYGKPGAYWDEVDDAIGYDVYRSTKSGSGYKWLGWVDGDSFVDTSAKKGKTYYYKVVAFSEYTESAMSNSVKLKSK